MSEINDGGPAFPHHFTQESIGDCSGMALRDYLAAKAMAALIAKSHGQDKTGGKEGVPLVAEYAYEYADAMLAARGPKP